MTLQAALNRAQRIADRYQTTIAVLDLNPHYSPLYVIRQWEACHENNPDLVKKVTPC